MKFISRAFPLILIVAQTTSATLISTRSLGISNALAKRMSRMNQEDPCSTETNALEMLMSDIDPGIPEGVCEVKVRGSETRLICNYNKFNTSEYEKACSDNGGQIFTYTEKQCAPAEMYGETPFPFDKFAILNYKRCFSTSCVKEQVLFYKDKMYESMGIHCPRETLKDKFILKYFKNKDKAKMKTCWWLLQQDESVREEICFSEKYQVYAQGELPASQVCDKTCKHYPILGECREEHEEAMFAVADQAGQVTIQTCGWLQQLDDSLKDMICRFGMYFLVDTEYGAANDVCTETCGCDSQFNF